MDFVGTNVLRSRSPASIRHGWARSISLDTSIVPPSSRQGASVAETSKGNKFVKVPAYDRKQDGHTVHVPAHDRSTPDTSKGKKEK